MTRSLRRLNLSGDDLFRAGEAEVGHLGKYMPQGAVLSLASDVLQRVAAIAAATHDAIHRPSHDQIDHFCYALISEDDGAAEAFLHDLRAEGATPEMIYLTYMAGAARRLGEWWDDNNISFVDVTIGTNRLYPIMRAMAPMFMPKDFSSEKSALFIVVPDESHTLGIHIATDLFRKDGWDIQLVTGKSHDELLKIIAATKHRIVGLSCSGMHSFEPMTKLVVATRILRPRTAILLGGGIEKVAPEQCETLGVDHIVCNMRETRTAMQAFWDSSIKSSQSLGSI